MQRKALGIWRLETGGDKYVGLIPHDLNYFHTHFTGEALPPDWVPPPTKIYPKSKKLPDFLCWMTAAPILSERAVEALSPLLADCVQFLPFHALKGRPYFAMNVIRMERGLLDHDRSNIFYSDETKRYVIRIKQAVFHEPLPEALPPIFKLVESRGNIYVTNSFAEVAIERQLTGLALADPSVYSLPLILNRLPLNVVPGIIN